MDDSSEAGIMRGKGEKAARGGGGGNYCKNKVSEGGVEGNSEKSAAACVQFLTTPKKEGDEWGSIVERSTTCRLGGTRPMIVGSGEGQGECLCVGGRGRWFGKGGGGRVAASKDC